MAPSAEDSSHLRDLVKEHRVAVELRPVFTVASEKRVQVGFDVALYGAHEGEHGPKMGEAECVGCAVVWDHMREIAAGVVSSSGNDEGIYRVDAYRPGVSVAANRKGADGKSREDVELILEIRARGEQVAGLPSCEEKCVRPIIESLRELGAREGGS
jgi:hypothetical protein